MVFTAGLTVRQAGLTVIPLCTTPSLQVIDQGAAPVRAAQIVAFCPLQIGPPPLTVAIGRLFTVTGALPLAVPAQWASETAVIVYLVFTAGLTVRQAGLVVIPLCTTPSLQVIDQGEAPVSAAQIVAFCPLQIGPPPLTAAVGKSFTVTSALPLAVPAQLASETAVIVYLVVVVGLTVRVTGLERMPL